MTSPMDAIRLASNTLSVANSIVDLTGSTPRFPTVDEIANAVAGRIGDLLSDELQQQEVNNISEWFGAYQAWFEQTYSADLAVNNPPFPAQHFLDTLKTWENVHATDVEKWAISLARLIDDPRTPPARAQTALEIYIGLELFLIGLQKEKIRVARLIDTDTARSEVSGRLIQIRNEAGDASSKAAALLKTVIGRRTADLAWAICYGPPWRVRGGPAAGRVAWNSSTTGGAPFWDFSVDPRAQNPIFNFDWFLVDREATDPYYFYGPENEKYVARRADSFQRFQNAYANALSGEYAGAPSRYTDGDIESRLNSLVNAIVSEAAGHCRSWVDTWRNDPDLNRHGNMSAVRAFGEWNLKMQDTIVRLADIAANPEPAPSGTSQ